MKESSKHIKGESGFTLLELLGVMAIIVTMSFVVVGGYMSMMRGINETAAINALRNSTMLCRQHAVLDSVRTYLVITGPNKYILCREGGTVGGGTGRGSVNTPHMGGSTSAYWITDDYADWTAFSENYGEYSDEDRKSMFGNSAYTGNKIFDMDTGKSCNIKYPPFFETNSDKWMLGVDPSDVDGKMFKIGSYYGWPLYDEKTLPSGYVFDPKHYSLDSNGNLKSSDRIYFDSDGSVGYIKSNGSESSSADISIGELDPNSSTGDIRNPKVMSINKDGKITTEI